MVAGATESDIGRIRERERAREFKKKKKKTQLCMSLGGATERHTVFTNNKRCVSIVSPHR